MSTDFARMSRNALARIRRDRKHRRSKYSPKDGTYKPAWKLDPNRVLGDGPPKDWR